MAEITTSEITDEENENMKDPKLIDELSSSSFNNELELCAASGGNMEEIKAAGLNLDQLTEIRKGLQSGVDISKFLDARIPWIQMEELRLELAENIDMTKYRAQGFELEQISEIRQGISDGVDVSMYANKTYFAEQMREIRLGLSHDVPVLFYKDPKFDWMQMAEIRLGIESNVDISLYARVSVPFQKMRVIRQSMHDGLFFDAGDIEKYDAGVLEQIHQAFLQGLDIKNYLLHGYGARALEQIRIALAEGISLTKYISREMSGDSIKEIRIGLEENLDVSCYASIDYGWQQMREIRKGLERRVNVHLYSNPYYLYSQMREVRKGLEENLDVSAYNNLIYSSAEMRAIRHKLEKGESIESSNSFDEEEEEYQYIFSDKEYNGELSEEERAELDKQNHYLKFTEDGLKCFLKLPTPGRGKDYTLDLVLAILQRANVVYGVKRNTISSVLLNEDFNKDILVAEGQPPVNGENGYYEFFFDVNTPSAPKEDENGQVDYSEVKFFEEVKVGNKIAEYHSAVKGTNGMNVHGKPIQGINGREKPILKGRGFLLLPDGKNYVAAVSGVVRADENELSINKLLVLDSLLAKQGAVNFSGSVWIKGDVQKGSSITALGDIVVDGFTEGADITAKDAVVLKQGASSTGSIKGRIEAGGDVYGKYFQQMEIHTGKSLYTNSCTNCDIMAEGRVECVGERGTIYGGTLTALMGCECAFLGNEQNIKTVISLGVTNRLMGEYNDKERELVKVKSELDRFKAEKTRLDETQVKTKEELQWKIKINIAVGMKNKELASLEEELNAIRDRIYCISSASAKVRNTVYAGTIVETDGVQLTVGQNRSEKNGIIFRKDRSSNSWVRLGKI